MRAQIIIFLFAATFVSGTVIDILKCDGVAEDKCTINEIRVEPCSNKRTCPIKKGDSAKISFDFTPHFSATQLKTKVSWNGVPWASMNPDACKDTTCPTQSGVQQTFTAELKIGKKLPSGKYTFKWEVYDEADESNNCCFQPTVTLRGR